MANSSSVDDERGHRHPRVGDHVRVRGRRWRVANLHEQAPCAMLTLEGAGPDNHLRAQRVITPFDMVDRIDRARSLRRVRAPEWRRQWRELVAAPQHPGMLCGVAACGIDLVAHQLEPVLAVVRGLGSRVLLADDVGLGKTIQAGLIIAELVQRGAAQRTLVLVPAALRAQWKDELSRRFALDAVQADMPALRRRLADIPRGINPWSLDTTVVSSLDYIKRPEVLPAVLSCRWDIVIVDEAHGVTPGSERYDAVSALCSRASYVLLLTATPHSGDPWAFASMCRLGAHGDTPLVFRRTRAQVHLGTHRRVHRLRVRLSDSDRRLYALLAEFSRAVAADRAGGSREASLVVAMLHKRALSSAAALALSIDRRLSVLGAAVDIPSQIALPLDDEEGEFDDADQPPEWRAPVFDDLTEERRWLLALAAAASAARDPKAAALNRLLRRLRRLGEPAIVFTEYRDTLLALARSLDSAATVVHGGVRASEREALVDGFRRGQSRLLLATDAAGEGLNLQHACRVVINLELPWNPSRLEQRIGRVDRIGQRLTVHVFHLIAAGSEENNMLRRLHGRIERARRDINVADPLASGSRAHSIPPSSLLQPHLGDEATLECVRLTHARRAKPRSLLQEADSDRPYLLTTRRPSLRRWLGHRALFVVQTTMEDDMGRETCAHLSAFLVESAPNRPWTAEEVARNLAVCPWGDVARVIDPLLINWQDMAASLLLNFWTTRRKREKAISTLVAGHVPPIQRGLFDARADIAHAEAERFITTQRAESAGRVSAAASAAIGTFRQTRVALILAAR